MTSTTSRRAVLAGIMATPALAAPVAAAIAAPVAEQTVQPIDPDATLRRLWADYCIERDAYNAAVAVYTPRRAALDAFTAPFETAGPGYALRDDWNAAWKKGWRKFKLGKPTRAMNRHADRADKLIKRIQATEARTLFGIGVKLRALPWWMGPDRIDYEEALDSALPDLEKLSGALQS